MNEVEVKVLDVDKNAIIMQLKSMGAKKIFDDVIEGVILDFKDKKIQNAGCTFRLRKEGKKTVIAAKKFTYDKFSKIAQELEFVADDYLDALNAFKLLGLIEMRQFKKSRVSFKVNDVRFDFDTMISPVKIPCYMEIEAKNNAIIKKYLAKLKIPFSNAKSYGYEKLLKHYNIK